MKKMEKLSLHRVLDSSELKTIYGGNNEGPSCECRCLGGQLGTWFVYNNTNCGGISDSSKHCDYGQECYSI